MMVLWESLFTFHHLHPTLPRPVLPVATGYQKSHLSPFQVGWNHQIAQIAPIPLTPSLTNESLKKNVYLIL